MTVGGNMNELQLNENDYITSMEVAEMIGKEHSKLLKDIRRYICQLGEAKIGFTDFFTENTYKTEQNKTQPCFKVSKKGCEFIANKLTGVKGTEFTAKYINRFHDMENTLIKVIPTDFPSALRAYADEYEKRIAIEQENKLLEEETIKMNKTISELEPKANYVDTILQSKSTVLVTQIAQDYGMSAKKFNQTLKDFGIQHKVGKQWILYADYQGKGYVHSRTIDITRSNGQPDVVMQTEWTQKGRLFLYDELKKHGIYPMIERMG